MLDNLRGMAVFASVVDNGSFSGAAKYLGITTSAVSQQVRALENDIGIVLLHRSTRKISLTEAGESFYQSCQEVVHAAKNGRIRLSALRDELTGQIRIASTPELTSAHLLPAMSEWLETHEGLSVHFEAENRDIDLIDERIDIALKVTDKIDENKYQAYPLCNVKQILVATPEFLQNQPALKAPEDLLGLSFVLLSLIDNANILDIKNEKTNEKKRLKVDSRLQTNNISVAKHIVKNSKGLMRVMDIDVRKELDNGTLVTVLPNWQLPDLKLYAVVLRREQYPAKVVRCLDVIQSYFNNLTNVDTLKTAS